MIGLSFVHVVPADPGAYSDVFASLHSLSQRNLWTYVIGIDQRLEPYLDDPDVLLIFWDAHAFKLDVLERPRRALIAAMFVEALDIDESKMLELSLSLWNGFKSRCHLFDAIFVHTPAMKRLLEAKHIDRPIHVLPAGWDRAAMGEPDWLRIKTTSYLYWGSEWSRRKVFDLFFMTYGPRLERARVFGKELLDKLQAAKAAIYIAHSLVSSGSTWRMWQAASTSAAIVAEPADFWPFEAGEHYIEIPRLTAENAEFSSYLLTKLLDDRGTLETTARAAHERAKQYTVDRIEHDFLVPAVQAMQARRQ